MKIKLQGKISEMRKDSNGNVTLSLTTNGKVETHLLNAKDATMSSILIIKGVIADDIKLGSTLTVTVSDEVDLY